MNGHFRGPSLTRQQNPRYDVLALPGNQKYVSQAQCMHLPALCPVSVRKTRVGRCIVFVGVIKSVMQKNSINASFHERGVTGSQLGSLNQTHAVTEFMGSLYVACRTGQIKRGGMMKSF